MSDMAVFSLRSATLCSIVIVTLVSEITADATLVIRMLRFDNPSSTKYSGGDCDFFGAGPCDPAFRFSLDRGNSGNDASGNYYWTYSSGKFQDSSDIVFGSTIAGVPNPIVTPLKPRWPSVGVKLKVIVTDIDVEHDDRLDELIYLLNPIPARSSSIANWTSVTVHGRRPTFPTSLTFKYKLYCDANYYSSDCSVYCVASDTDAAGHYTCDPATGNITCRSGWKNKSARCKTPADISTATTTLASTGVPPHAEEWMSDANSSLDTSIIIVITVISVVCIVLLVIFVRYLYTRSSAQQQQSQQAVAASQSREENVMPRTRQTQQQQPRLNIDRRAKAGSYHAHEEPRDRRLAVKRKPEVDVVLYADGRQVVDDNGDQGYREPPPLYTDLY